MRNSVADIKEFYVTGLMSGTSLDGVDIAFCRFEKAGESWHYSVEEAQTFAYSEDWKKRLVDAETSSGLELMLLHKEYGTYLGKLTNEFLAARGLKPDFISSHGHTIFHQPEKRLTFQLGDGAYIAAETQITTISDFRNLDVALGGQGAPLVPIGDELLFSDYDQCLNLGGFANISYNDLSIRKAFDICPVNIMLNHLTRVYCNLDYDKDGNLGKAGDIHSDLLNKLNELKFYQVKAPKSLGKEWVLENFLPEIETFNIPVNDKLRTVYEHIAVQLSSIINSLPGRRVLVTGGGAYNSYLIGILQAKINKQIVIPDSKIVDFKEALIFAFLGLLRYLELPNCLASVTGASMNNSGGVIHRI